MKATMHVNASFDFVLTNHVGEAGRNSSSSPCRQPFGPNPSGECCSVTSRTSSGGGGAAPTTLSNDAACDAPDEDPDREPVAGVLGQSAGPRLEAAGAAVLTVTVAKRCWGGRAGPCRRCGSRSDTAKIRGSDRERCGHDEGCMAVMAVWRRPAQPLGLRGGDRTCWSAREPSTRCARLLAGPGCRCCEFEMPRRQPVLPMSRGASSASARRRCRVSIRRGPPQPRADMAEQMAVACRFGQAPSAAVLPVSLPRLPCCRRQQCHIGTAAERARGSVRQAHRRSASHFAS